jgi:alpha-beta hydrolase superfamily lysophospholipase
MHTTSSACFSARRSFAPCSLGAALVLLLLGGATVFAQAKDEKKEFPLPQTVVRETTDGMLIRCQYYYGGIDEKTKKSTVPVIIVHDDGEEAKAYDGLAALLQKQGHAVLVPDLRGHGGSTSYRSGAKFEADDFKRSERAATAAMGADLEAAKRFLLEQNNAGELNIELLTVIGVGDMGSVVATNWVAADWSWPQLPGRKQGQDVKALVLLSPAGSFKGVTSRAALGHPFLQNRYPTKSSVLLVVGKADRTSYADTGRIFKALEKAHEINKTLYKVEKDTSLSGARLLDRRLPLNVDTNIANFIRLKIVNNADNFPWRVRQ